MQIFWQLSASDGRYPWEEGLRWRDDFAHVRNIATAIDTVGFTGVLVAIGPQFIYDGWTLASSLIPVTERIKFLIAVYPGLVTPTQLALMARSFDRLSNGRLMINVVGSNPVTMRANGIHYPKEQRYEMLLEYWALFRAIYAGEKLPQASTFFDLADVESQLVHLPPTQHPHPPLWAAGGSPEGVRAATSLCETYLAVVDTPQGLKVRTDIARAAAAAQGRHDLHYGISLPVIVRETEDEAWAVAERWLRHTPMSSIKASAGWAAAMAPDADLSHPAVRRCVEALKADTYPDVRDLEVHPNMWCGPNHVSVLDLTRRAGGAGMTLVGSAEQVAGRLREIERVAGIDRFILRGFPMIEETYRVSELLLPLLDLDTPADPLFAHPSPGRG